MSEKLWRLILVALVLLVSASLLIVSLAWYSQVQLDRQIERVEAQQRWASQEYEKSKRETFD